MPAPQDVKEAPPKGDMSVAVSGQDAARKVELDLDDAPFLVAEEEKSPPPARADELSLPDKPAEEAAASDPDTGKKKKKKLILLLGGVVGALALAGAAVWWFVLRTPPPPPVEPEPIKPEVIVVPDEQPEAAAPADTIKELAAFVIPRQTAGGTRFLTCKFSTVSKNAVVNQEIDRKLIALRDALYFYLNSKGDAFLLDHANVPAIKKDLNAVINDYLTQGKVDDILFESYLNE